MYPSELQYKHSVEYKMYPPANGGYRFLPVLNNNNEVLAAPGARAVVFKVNEESTGKPTALKFFTVEDQNRFQHYNEISRYLKNIKSKYFVNFRIIENLIYVEFDTENLYNNYFEGLVMEWANGVTLQSKLKELCAKNEKSKISKLKDNFKKLALFLLSEQIAHGDLKHDNIIVNNRLDLVLVDYDGIYIPPFKGSLSSGIGTSSFQHPRRNNNDFNSRIDDFSILTIYTSLVALEHNQELFNEYYDEQNLLFTLEDFLNPNKSELLKTLSRYKATKELVFFIKQSLASESIYIYNLKDLLNGLYFNNSVDPLKDRADLISEIEILKKKLEASKISNTYVVNIGASLEAKIRENDLAFIKKNRQIFDLTQTQISDQQQIKLLSVANNEYQNTIKNLSNQIVEERKNSKGIIEQLKIEIERQKSVKWYDRLFESILVFFPKLQTKLSLNLKKSKQDSMIENENLNIELPAKIKMGSIERNEIQNGFLTQTQIKDHQIINLLSKAINEYQERIENLPNQNSEEWHIYKNQIEQLEKELESKRKELLYNLHLNS